ncbi:MAG: LacI family DNA-binding transcriptional regulator [Pseudomonadota bacterium]
MDEGRRSASNAKVTLRKVAKAAGVSLATVSRVLNDAPNVSAETKDRVRAVMKALRYTPSATARQLSTGRTRVVGALVPTVDHAIFARFLGALEQRLSEIGYTLVVSCTQNDAAMELQKAQALLATGAEGLIVSGVTRHPDFASVVEDTGVPVIVSSYFDDTSSLPTIGYDNGAIAALALRHLVEAGHEMVAVLHGPVAGNDRTAARLGALRSYGDRLALHEVVSPLTMVGGQQAARAALAAGRPSAMLCLSDVLALGALFEIQRQGLSIPADISIMGMDDLEWASICNPPLTTIALPVEEMGGCCAEAICHWIETGAPTPSKKIGAEVVRPSSSVAPVRPMGRKQRPAGVARSQPRIRSPLGS